MSCKSLLRRGASWLALWAVVLHALAPGLARAVIGWAEPGLTHEICSSTGMVRLAATPSEEERDAGTAAVHCEWCLLDVVADLPAGHALGLGSAPVANAPIPVPAAPALAVPWRRALPRAPPAFA